MQRVFKIVLYPMHIVKNKFDDSDGNRVALYAKASKKLYDKELEVLE